MLALCYGRLLENLAGLYRNSDLCAIAANAATTQNENPSKMKPKGTAAFQIANNQQTGRPSVNTRICRWLVPSLLLIFSEMTVAAEAQEKLIRGLWLLTTQAGPIRPDDVQRALRINPSHYVSTSGGSPWDATYSLKEPYRKETAITDTVTDIYIGLGEFVVLEGPPRDVGTRQKVKITFKNSSCVSAESMQAISHSARTAAGQLQFKNETARTTNLLDFDVDCANSVLITKLFIPPPLPAKSAP